MFSTTARSRFVGAILGIVLANVIATSAHAVSIFIGPGGFTPLVGNTLAAEADLAGVVLRDAVIPFTITDAAGVALYKASLQNRVVRSTLSGHLHFSYRIRNVNATLLGRVASIQTSGYGNWNCWVEYRTDGLGALGPVNAVRSALPGSIVNFNMPAPGLGGGAESKFMYLKTTAINWGPGGVTTITLTSGQSVTLATVHPVP